VQWSGKGNFRLVHLTDLHVGLATPSHLLRQTIEHCRQLKPNLMVLTGDFINHSLKYLPELGRLIRALPRPCVATLGNHDHWYGAGAVQRQLEEQGAIVLRNGHIQLTVKGKYLPIVGIDDGRSNHHDVNKAFCGLQHPEQALVLTHDPKTADRIASHGARLILAGHTHGGQLSLPLVTQAICRLVGRRYISGWYSVGNALLYVNAGIGSAVIRMRLGAPATPEVAVIDLV
jgi:predicted MPP superfamily phosphohydrolase